MQLDALREIRVVIDDRRFRTVRVSRRMTMVALSAFTAHKPQHEIVNWSQAEL
jgi:hypothetical protein